MANEKPKFIFIHINKTGGSSVEKALGLPFEHLTALELKKKVGAETWKRAFKFTIIRNPWAKVVSHYFYRVETNQTGLGDGHLTFQQWVVESYGKKNPRYYDNPKMFMPQLDWIGDKSGEIMIDFVGRFENLQEDFQFVCRKLGFNAELPHVKRSKHPAYARCYDDKSREIVKKHFAKDIARFSYQFVGE